MLGIDAAWTAAQPSGVALAVERRRGWTCAGLAPSYAAFLALASGIPVDWDARAFPGGVPDAAALLAACARLAPDAQVTVVAVDMPLARRPIRGRRSCDDAFSRAFARRGLGVHSPSAVRPGPIADRLRAAFVRRGFTLATGARRGPRELAEVYPHAAVLALLGSAYRVPYKAARARRYWPDAAPGERRERVWRAWRRIRSALRRRIAGIALPLPRAPPPGGRMKRYEDALDAVVCAWVGIELLEGRARAFGDGEAAIWTPD